MGVQKKVITRCVFQNRFLPFYYINLLSKSFMTRRKMQFYNRIDYLFDHRSFYSCRWSYGVLVYEITALGTLDKQFFMFLYLDTG